MYSSSNCVVKVCEAWKAQYGVVPYKTYGTLPETLKASWDYPRPTMKGRTCNSLAGGCDGVARSTGPTSACAYTSARGPPRLAHGCI